MKKSAILFLATIAVLFTAPAAFAAGAGGEHNPIATAGLVVIAIVVLGFAVCFMGVAMGKVISIALEGTARNPGAYQALFPSMVIGLALMEALVIYVFIIVLILLFANPL